MSISRNDFWRDRPVFISGATGLLGSWLTRSLVEAGANVVTLVRDWTPTSAFNQWQLSTTSTIVRGSLEDYELLERALNEYEIDTLFHVGAQTIVPIANRSPLSTFSANIEGTWKLLE